MNKMKSQIQKDDHRFYMSDAHEMYAEIAFEIDGEGRIVITHTFVAPNYRGQGLANVLLEEIIKMATNEQRLIIPQCEFAAKVLNSKPKYKHLLASR
ncbi:MAG TPA: N-acetyltransferase [Firmicutes bacterium]|jgi:hypothetical protein|nr:N-acetyltransferase [Bacillota bacterium]